MAYNIVDFDGTVTASTSDYPYRQIKDDPDGTAANVKSNGDIQQFFQVLMHSCGITPNGSPDNVSNGYQTLQSIGKSNSAAAGQIMIQMLGANYDAAKVYVLSGAASRSADGYIFYNGNVYYLIGNPNPPCALSGTTDVIIANNAVSGVPNTRNGLLCAKVSCETTGSGWVNYSAVTRTFYLLTGPWANLSGQGGGQWAAGAVQPRYKKDSMGNVEMQGQFITLSGSLSTVIDTLPTGYRPPVDVQFSVLGWNTTTFYTVYIKVTSGGVITYEPAGSLPSAANWYVDISPIRFSVIA